MAGCSQAGEERSPGSAASWRPLVNKCLLGAGRCLGPAAGYGLKIGPSAGYGLKIIKAGKIPIPRASVLVKGAFKNK